MTDDTSYTGHQDITSGGSENNSEHLHLFAVADERRHVVPVRVIAVRGGGIAAAPTVDVQPLIDQVDGLGNRTPHAPVYNRPVSRVHSGSGAIISDPVVGDVMIMSVADRDISSLVANNGQQSGPGSKRRSSMSDGIVHHAMLSPAPTQYVYFKPGGGFVVADNSGCIVETHPDTKMMTQTVPSGWFLALGGDPAKGGVFGFVETDQGTSTVVKAKL